MKQLTAEEFYDKYYNPEKGSYGAYDEYMHKGTAIDFAEKYHQEKIKEFFEFYKNNFGGGFQTDVLKSTIDKYLNQI